MTTIGLIGAGAMGSGLGSAWRAAGNDVVTAVGDRSERTRRLAAAAGIRATASLDEVVAVADVLVSVVPPKSAVDAARAAAAAADRTNRHPLFADLNAISPARMHEIAHLIGPDVVDGSISGPPPHAGGVTRLYFSGTRAPELAAIASRWIEPIVVGTELGTASAIKMCTASMYKGVNALLMQALLTAQAHGVVKQVLADLSNESAGAASDWPRRIALGATKAWRYVDEMHEIAATQAAAGLPAALFDGVAAVYDRTSRTSLGAADPETVAEAPELTEVLDRLR